MNALELMSNMSDLLMSAGAACHSGDGKGSGVLEAMGVSLGYQLGTLRLSLGRFCDVEMVDQVTKIFSNSMNKN